MAVFDFRNVDEVAAIWFVSDQRSFDWAGCLVRVGNEWCATSRFRYYRSPDPWDGKDIKNEYQYRAPSRDQLMAALDEAARRAAAHAGPGCVNDRFEINGDANKAMGVLMAQPWCHIKIVPTRKGKADQ